MEKVTFIIGSLFLLITLSGCSNNAAEKKSSSPKTIYTLKEVQQGTVVAVNKRIIPSRQYRPNGNIGVSIGSGGHAGIYGAMDILSIGRLIKGPEKPKVVYEIIIKRDNGEMVAVTQPATVSFNRGDRVKILQREGQARVIH